MKGGIVRTGPGNFMHFEDPDANELYLWESPSYIFSEHDTANAGA